MAILLGRLVQDSFVGMGMDGVEGVDTNRGAPVAKLRPKFNTSIGLLISECTGAIRTQKAQPPYVLTGKIECH